LFEQINSNTESDIEGVVDTALEVYFPRVEKIDMQVNSNPDNNLISFYLSYRISDTNIEDELLINIEA